MSDVVAILLAAGAGSRFVGERHKLLADLPASSSRPPEPVGVRALSSVIEAKIGPVVVVTGAIDIERAVTAGMHLDEQSSVSFVDNPNWESGQASSIQLAAAVAREQNAAERVVIGLADQPGITAEAWRAVSSAGADASLAVATYDGRRGNPVAVHLDIWHLMPEAGDVGARNLMRLRPDLVVEVPCSGSSDDIDTTEDLRRWQNNSSTNSP